jgi:CRISPR/Cas system-associated endonuclease Cas3-HD
MYLDEYKENVQDGTADYHVPISSGAQSRILDPKASARAVRPDLQVLGVSIAKSRIIQNFRDIQKGFKSLGICIPVYVHIRSTREMIMDYKLHTTDVETTGCNVCCNKDRPGRLG